MEDLLLKCLPVAPLQANCYLVGSTGSGRCAVIDPGGEADLLAAEVNAAGLEVSFIINTHAHFDHAGGNQRLKELTGAPILIHPADAPALRLLGAQARLFMIECPDSPPADRLLEDGESIDLGGLSLTVMHTPGHTPGGISLAAPGVVFSGDTLFAGSVGRTDLPGGSYDQLAASIRERLYSLAEETVVLPGHGPPTTIGEELHGNPFVR